MKVAAKGRIELYIFLLTKLPGFTYKDSSIEEFEEIFEGLIVKNTSLR